jgi:hypothetical protein
VILTFFAAGRLSVLGLLDMCHDAPFYIFSNPRVLQVDMVKIATFDDVCDAQPVCDESRFHPVNVLQGELGFCIAGWTNAVQCQPANMRPISIEFNAALIQ